MVFLFVFVEDAWCLSVKPSAFGDAVLSLQTTKRVGGEDGLSGHYTGCVRSSVH